MHAHLHRHPEWWTASRVPTRYQLSQVGLAKSAAMLVGAILNGPIVRNLSPQSINAPAATAIGVGQSPAGRAGSFDGSSSLFSFPDQAPLDISGVSFLIGVTPRAVSATMPVLGRWADVGVNKRSWMVALRSAGDVTIDASSNGNFNANARATIAGVANAGQRITIAGRAGDGAQAFITVDGRLSDTASGAGSAVGSLFATDIPLEIGSAEFGGASRLFFNGAIDYVFVWNVLFSTPELMFLARNPKALLAPAQPPVSRYAASAPPSTGHGPLIAGYRNRLVIC